jgi:hypothetical protein
MDNVTNVCFHTIGPFIHKAIEIKNKLMSGTLNDNDKLQAKLLIKTINAFNRLSADPSITITDIAIDEPQTTATNESQEGESGIQNQRTVRYASNLTIDGEESDGIESSLEEMDVSDADNDSDENFTSDEENQECQKHPKVRKMLYKSLLLLNKAKNEKEVIPVRKNDEGDDDDENNGEYNFEKFKYNPVKQIEPPKQTDQEVQRQLDMSNDQRSIPITFDEHKESGQSDDSNTLRLNMQAHTPVHFRNRSSEPPPGYETIYSSASSHEYDTRERHYVNSPYANIDNEIYELNRNFDQWRCN